MKRCRIKIIVAKTPAQFESNVNEYLQLLEQNRMELVSVQTHIVGNEFIATVVCSEVNQNDQGVQ